MALFKCKMCGGSLNIIAGSSIAKCKYCDTQQTLPKTTDENIQSLFNRATLLRMKGEFDRASDVYEKILEANAKEAEAYWGVILCKFGIEYVEDPKTYKRIPTCHRTSYESIVADEYYKKAIEYADASQRAIYETEARAIDAIQKGILEISSREEPYDVFICYKETDENGNRTQDSVIANDIYYQLTNQGYKVFYAAITLEDKLGSAYEPIIFAALNSSKVMLAIGTKPEYFNAVWVKNEWSRFLKMIKQDRTKLLIPCYRDMDPYELPDEFAHLQAQDMSKIGFINDIVRGISKVVVKNTGGYSSFISKPEPTPVVEVKSPATSPLLERAFLFIEDGDWKSAQDYCERVLDQDPKNGLAYLAKLMIDLKVKTREELADQPRSFEDNGNYSKLVRFADTELLREARGYLERCKRSILCRDAYAKAKKLIENATSESDIDSAVKLLEEISDYRDASEIAVKCKETWTKSQNRYKFLITNYKSLLNKKSGQKTKVKTVEDKISEAKKEIEKLEGVERSFGTWLEANQDLKHQLFECEGNLGKLTKTRAGLGIFAFRQKKEIDTQIAELGDKMKSLKESIASIEKDINYYRSADEIAKALGTLRENLAEYESELRADSYNNTSLGTIDEVIAELFSSELYPLLHTDKNAHAEIMKLPAAMNYLVKNKPELLASSYDAPMPVELLRKLEGTEDECYYLEPDDHRSEAEIVRDMAKYYDNPRFAEYEIIKEAPPTRFGAHPKCKPVTFLFRKNGKDVLAVVLVKYTAITHGAVSSVKKACEERGIKYQRFIVGYPNTEHYVVRKTLEKLGEIPYLYKRNGYNPL